MDCRAAVELGVDQHRHFQTADGRADHIGVRNGTEKITAHGNQRFHLATQQGFAGLGHGVTFFSGRLETEHLAHAGQKRFSGLFIDAHRPVALYVGVSTYRASTRTELADVAAQQQQVDDLLHGVTAALVLSDAHSPAADDPLRALIDRRHLFDGLRVRPEWRSMMSQGNCRQ